MDTSKTGTMSRVELGGFLRKTIKGPTGMSHCQIKDLVEFLDANRDDEISLSELKVVFEPLMKMSSNTLTKPVSPLLMALSARDQRTKERLQKKVLPRLT